VSFFRNALGVFVTSAGLAVTGLATSVVLARFLSVDDRGLYSVLAAFVALTTALAHFGWSEASIYQLRRVGAPPAQVASAALAALALLSAVATGAAWILREPIRERFLEGAPELALALALASAPLRVVGEVFASLARGLDRFGLHNAYRLGRTIALLAALGAVLVARDGGLVEAVAASLGVEALATVAVMAAVIRRTGLARRLDAGGLWRTVRFGATTHAQNVVMRLHESVDVFLIAWLLGDPRQVAFYTIAVGVVERLRIVTESVGAALFPQLAGHEEREAGAFASLVSRHSLFWVVGAAAALALLGPWLVPLLYGEPYRASLPAFFVLLPGVAVFTLYRVLMRYFMALGRQGVNFRTQAIALALNVALNVWWIPELGILGAAAASLVSYAVEAALITIAFRRQSGRGVRETLLLGPADVALYRRRLEPLLHRVRGR
jgi:O-antigen/teichoic acid export membrane protein